MCLVHVCVTQYGPTCPSATSQLKNLPQWVMQLYSCMISVSELVRIVCPHLVVLGCYDCKCQHARIRYMVQFDLSKLLGLLG